MIYQYNKNRIRSNETPPDDEAKIQGTVLKLTFRNEENGYTVAQIHAVRTGAKELTVVGNFPSIDVGEVGEFHGKWEKDSQWGWQFTASHIDFIVPTSVQGIKNLLTKGKFKGIGEKYANLIVEKFGKETINVIENKPERLKDIPGIGDKKIREITISWNKKRELKHINIFLAENDLPLHLAEKIFGRYKSNSLFVLKNHTHKLAEDIKGIGFKKADDIALKIGIEPTSPDRISAALIYSLKQAAEEGHIFLPHEELFQKARDYLQVDFQLIEDEIENLSQTNKIAKENGNVFIRFLFAVENNVVSRINTILNTPSLQLKEFDVDKEISAIEKNNGIVYSKRQKEALLEAFQHKIVVVTGGPGTGKTTIVKALLHLFRKATAEVRLAAPTGRAAKRMEETCKIPAKTIHRFLDYDPASWKFSRNVRSPVKTDVVIIDEISMIDTPLMAALLSGIANQSRVILVGDADQLPSVGPGNVLRDLLDSRAIPSIELDFIFRQEETSDIVVAAHKINSGEVPYIDNSKNKNLFFINEQDTEQIPGKISDLIKRRLPDKYGYNPVRDVQVLTSMYKGATGANNLNSLLQNTLGAEGKSLIKGERSFAVGDKVMQVRNNYTKDIYNGDIGFITQINFEDSELEINFDSKIVSYSSKNLNELVHAYAITVHKSQGSEYKAAVMPITTQHYIMLQKNLIYTAITRAKELMIFIGTYKAFNIAVKNNKTELRYTYLSERLKNPDRIESQLNLLDSVSGYLNEWY